MGPLGLYLVKATTAGKNCHAGIGAEWTKGGKGGGLGRKPLLGVVSSAEIEVNTAISEERVSASSTHEITSLLRAWCAGDAKALERLIPFVYRELHQAAHRQMLGGRQGHTLQTSALINEAYLRLVGFREVSWQNRAHFLAVCAMLMRQMAERGISKYEPDPLVALKKAKARK